MPLVLHTRSAYRVPIRGGSVKRFLRASAAVRRSAADAEQTRRAILAAARSSFAEHGFAAASTTAIARAAGVTRGAVYHHFAGKSDLFREVFVEIEHELNESVVAAARAETDSLAAFIAGSAAWLDFAVRPDYQRIAVVDAPAVIGAAEWHEIDAGIGLVSMEAGLAALAADGVLSRPPSRALAVLLFGALTDAGLALARGDGPAKGELLDEFVFLVTAAPGATPTIRRPGRRAR
jgi:AcrR family transcriptional regulator